MILWVLLFLAGAEISHAGTFLDSSLPYTDTTSARALKNLELLGSRDPSLMTESEKGEWVRARFAWIALLRLQGKELNADEAFLGCRSVCEKWGSSAEWDAVKRWGCARNKNANSCKKR